MTKAELIEKLHSKWDGQVTKKLVTDMVDELFDTVSLAIKKEKTFAFPGFGTFKIGRAHV